MLGISQQLEKGVVNKKIADKQITKLNTTQMAIKIKGLELINIEGINVYDILRKEKLVLTKRSVEILNERLQ